MNSERENTPAVDLDTALFMTGMGKFHIGLVIVAGGCIASTTADTLGLSFALPTVACDLNLSAGEKGLFSAASYMGMFLTTHIWAFASDTYGRRGILILSLVIGLTLSVGTSLAPVFWLLVLLRFLTGSAYAGMASTFYSYLAEFVPPERRTKFVAWMFLFEGSMFILIPGVSWLILPFTWSLDLGFVVFRSWRLLILLNGTYALFTILAILWFPESPKYLVSVGRQQEAIDILGRIFSLNTGRPSHEYPVHAIKLTEEDKRTVQPQMFRKCSVLTIFKSIKNQVTPIFGCKHIRSTALASILEFCMYASAFGLYLWLPDILNRLTKYSTENPNVSITVCDVINMPKNATISVTCQSEVDPTVYISSLIIGVVDCLGYALLGVLANAISKKIMIGTLQIISGLAGFGIYFASDSISVTISFFIYISQPSLALAPLSAAIVDLYPTHLRSTAMSVVLSFGRIGAYLTGNVIGALFERNCTLTIFSLSAMSIGSGLLSIFIPTPNTKEAKPA